MATAKPLTELSGAELARLESALEGTDTVELKVTLPELTHRSAIAALGVDPLDAQIRQVFFFDTPDLRLNRAGLVTRARRIQGKGGDSVVKVRPVVPDQLPPKLRGSRGFGVEVDAMPGAFVCSASMKGVTGVDEPRDVASGALPIRKLFNKQQRAFFKERAPSGIGMDDLSVLGPIFVLKAKRSPAGFARRLVVELWLYPDGSRILELSTKCPPAEAFPVAAETRSFLNGAGIDLSGEQQTKTKTALAYFAKGLQQASR